MEYLNNKNILLISPEPWSHIFVSKHHYAIELAKRGNYVYFLNPPADVGNVVIDKTNISNVFVVNYQERIKGKRFLPRLLRKWFDVKLYRLIEKVSNCKFDIV